MAGKPTDAPCLPAGRTAPCSCALILVKPVKSLGKVVDCSLRDTAAIQMMIKELETWLSVVDKSGLPGKFKAWMYQHSVLPRVQTPASSEGGAGRSGGGADQQDGGHAAARSMDEVGGGAGQEGVLG